LNGLVASSRSVGITVTVGSIDSLQSCSGERTAAMRMRQCVLLVATQLVPLRDDGISTTTALIDTAVCDDSSSSRSRAAIGRTCPRTSRYKGNVTHRGELWCHRGPLRFNSDHLHFDRSSFVASVQKSTNPDIDPFENDLSNQKLTYR
jgi:hypothetical protein